MARRPSTLVLAALWCALAFLALLAVAYGSDAARSLDANALHGFIDLQRPAVEGAIDAVARLGDPASVGMIVAGLVAVALLRGRPRLAVAVVLLLAATSVSSQLLKALLAYPRFGGLVDGAHVAPAAFPSGHATAAMSVALAGVLVAPSRARPAAAVLGLAFALGVALCVVSLGWHFPSDVVGGYLLATFWTLLVAAGLLAASERWPERHGRTRMTAVLQRAADRVTTVGIAALALTLLVGVAVAGMGVLLTRPGGLVDFAGEHTGLVAVAGAVALAAAAVLGGVTAALRRP